MRADPKIDQELDTLAQQFIALRRGHRAGVITGDRQVTQDRDAGMDRLLNRALGLLRKKRRRARGLKGLFYWPGRRLLLKDWRAVLARHE